jgi:hypothetical protein
VTGDLAQGFAWSFGEGHVQSSDDSSSGSWTPNERAA